MGPHNAVNLGPIFRCRPRRSDEFEVNQHFRCTSKIQMCGHLTREGVLHALICREPYVRWIDMINIKTLFLTTLLLAIFALAGDSNASAYYGFGNPPDVYTNSSALYQNPGIKTPQEPGSYSSLLPIPDLNPPPISVNQEPGFGFHSAPGPVFAPTPPTFQAPSFPAVGEP
jgi:hypothetical protein